MTAFDTFVVIDWTGGRDTGARPRKDAIWAAVNRGEVADAPVYLRNRQVAEDWIAALIDEETAAGRRVFIGFDFPFGYPDGFARRVTGSDDPLALWDWFANNLKDAPDGNNRFHLAASLNALFPGTGPFWFNGLKEDVEGLPRKGRAREGHGMPDRRRCEVLATGAFTCWQMGGAGAVGSQVMTGMACLSRLRARFATDVAVWPFESLDKPVAFVEVWPSLHASEIAAETNAGEIKDAAQVRVMAQRIAGMQRSDALSSAISGVPVAARREEGWIFGLSPRQLVEAA